MSKYLFLKLQLFAEGGDGGTGAEGATGVNATDAASQQGVKNPLANVKYGIQDGSDAGSVSQDDRAAKFEELIKNEYKDLYSAKVQDTIQKRLKGTQQTVDRYNQLAPTIEMLAKKYGVKADDIEGLNKAIEEDDAYYEDEALEKGVTVQQLKEIRKMERENAELKRQMDEKASKEKADQIYAKWMQDADATKKVYPNFSLETEMADPRFTSLLKSGIDVKTAFEVVHKDEIIPAAMQYTAQTVERKLTNKILAGGRPTENGASAQSAALVKSDVSQLSKADRQEIIRRVQRGEKIRF